jgi:hypothetical protein
MDWRDALFFLGLPSLVACGTGSTPAAAVEQGSGGSGTVISDASAGDGAMCLPSSIDQFTPIWAPPKRTVGACTHSQIEKIYTSCDFDSPFWDTTECRTFEVDPANAPCLDCMYSIEGDPSYGAILFLRDGHRRTNDGGCMALIDGDTGASGCGAAFWALERCGDTACEACSDAARRACRLLAEKGVCLQYARNAACARKLVYGPCFGFTSYKEAFLGNGAMFCSAPTDGGSSSDLDTTTADVVEEGADR